MEYLSTNHVDEVCQLLQKDRSNLRQLTLTDYPRVAHSKGFHV